MALISSSSSEEEVASTWDTTLSRLANGLISARLAMYADPCSATLLRAIRRLRQYVERTTQQRQASVVVELVASSVLSPLLQEFYVQDDCQDIAAELLRIVGQRSSRTQLPWLQRARQPDKHTSYAALQLLWGRAKQKSSRP